MKMVYAENDAAALRAAFRHEVQCLDAAKAEIAKLRLALELIAAPMRPDGTWNRDRKACQELAAAALK